MSRLWLHFLPLTALFSLVPIKELQKQAESSHFGRLNIGCGATSAALALFRCPENRTAGAEGPDALLQRAGLWYLLGAAPRRQHEWRLGP